MGHPKPVTPAPYLVLFQQHIQPILKRTDPRQRLNLASIIKCAFRRSDRLADYLPRHMQITRDRLDRLPAGILTPDTNHCLQNQHPDLAA
jgi:hypothetical protein